MNNREFSKTDEHFINACEKAGIKATVRQASKFRREVGAAYKAKKNK